MAYPGPFNGPTYADGWCNILRIAHSSSFKRIIRVGLWGMWLAGVAHETMGARVWVNFSLAASRAFFTSLFLRYILPAFWSDLIAKFTPHLPVHGKCGSRQAACLSFLAVRLLGLRFWRGRSDGSPLKSHCWNPTLSPATSCSSFPSQLCLGWIVMYGLYSKGRKNYILKILSFLFIKLIGASNKDTIFYDIPKWQIVELLSFMLMSITS